MPDTSTHQFQKQEVDKILAKAGQQHLTAFWEELTVSQQQRLAREILDVDFALVQQLYEDQMGQPDWGALAARATSPPAVRLDDKVNVVEITELARSALRNGRVGVILVAGGQGTRLGFPHPKGMYPIGPISKRTLFQLHFEQLLALSRRYGQRIPLYLMTSPATHDETVAFLNQHAYFGLPPQDVRVFCQGTMPAVDSDGKLLLSKKGAIFKSPDGHGGMLAALAKSGCLDDMRQRELEQAYYFQVDNPLVDIADLRLVGSHLRAHADMTTQVVQKSKAMDKVGNVVVVDGRMMVIEYSDLPDDAANRRNAQGELDLWAGSIAVHVFRVDFLSRIAESGGALPFHQARKKVPYVDVQGRLVKPDKPNATKFEKFIFDLMPSARNALVVEVDASVGFAPLKNASGAATDTPETTQRALSGKHAAWLRDAGAVVAEDIDVEINPLFALDAEELASKIDPGLQVVESTYWPPQ